VIVPLPFQAIHLTGPGIAGVCSFSGDTQPTEVLAKVGMNAKLLIHEATMADDQAELARMKAHSTVGQAIDIGRKCVLLSECPFKGTDDGTLIG